MQSGCIVSSIGNRFAFTVRMLFSDMIDCLIVYYPENPLSNFNDAS